MTSASLSRRSGSIFLANDSFVFANRVTHREPGMADGHIVERNHTTSFFFVCGFGSGAYSAELLAGTKASVLGLEPAAPVRRGSVADIGDRRATHLRRRRHPPTHHRHFATVAGIADHGCRIIGKHTRQWCEVADVAVDVPEQCDDEPRLSRGERFGRQRRPPWS